MSFAWYIQSIMTRIVWVLSSSVSWEFLSSSRSYFWSWMRSCKNNLLKISVTFVISAVMQIFAPKPLRSQFFLQNSLMFFCSKAISWAYFIIRSEKASIIPWKFSAETVIFFRRHFLLESFSLRNDWNFICIVCICFFTNLFFLTLRKNKCVSIPWDDRSVLSSTIHKPISRLATLFMVIILWGATICSLSKYSTNNETGFKRISLW